MKKNTVALVLIIFSFQLQTTGCARRNKRPRYISRRRSIISKFKNVGHADFDKYHIPKQYIFKPDNNETKPKEPLLVLLWENAPDAYYIIERTDKMPDYSGKIRKKYGIKIKPSQAKRITRDKHGRIKKVVILKGKGYRKWITAKKMGYEKLQELATAVHEECHHYTSKFPDKLIHKRYKSKNALLYRSRKNPNRFKYAQYYAFYLNRRKTLILRLRNVFPSREITYLIPKKYKKPYSKFRGYISGRSHKYHVTQVNGIYGLLNEYNAYYWSTKAVLGYYNYFKKKGFNRKNIYTFERLLLSNYSPWFEFRYFILTYLIHAKRKHPEIYKTLINDKQLRKVFTAIDDNFFALYRKINNTVKRLKAYAKRRRLLSAIRFHSICLDYIKTMQSMRYAKIARLFRLHPQKYTLNQCHYVE